MFIRNRFTSFLSTIVFAAGCSAKSNLFSPDDVYVFPGIGKVNVEANGSLILSWDKVPADAPTYFVFRRLHNEKFDWNNSFKTTNSNSLEYASYPLTQKYCFAVRFNQTGINEDSNTNEICPTLPFIEGFDGVDTAVSNDTGVAVISWKKPTSGMDEVEGYRVYLGTDFKTQVGSASARDSSVSIGSLTPDESFTFGVRAYDKYGREDANTRTVSVGIVNNALPVFAGVDTLTQDSSSSIKVVWASADIKPAKYNIYKATSAANSTVAVPTTTAHTTVSATTYSKVVTGLGDEQSHCFTVKAETSGGQKDQNTIVKCLTLPDTGAPLFNGIKSLTFASGGAAVSWDEAVGQTTSYKVYYQQGTTLDFNTASVTTITAPAASANITGLADNRSWTFAVRAVDSHNNYDSNSVTMTATAGDLTPPTFVGYVSSVALSETSIQLVFQRSVDVDTSRYDIKIRQTTVGGAYTKVSEASQVSSGNITSTLTGLLPATSYDLLVTALDTSGNPSTNSAFLTRATLDLTAPNFGGVTSAAKKATDATKMMVYWNAAIDTGGLFEYRVFYSTQSLIGKTLVRSATYPLVDGAQTIYMSNSVSSSATSVELSGLAASTTYYFVVHAVDAAGNEDNNTIQATATMPNFTAPAAVTGLSFNPAPGAATINRVPFVNGSGVVGNTAFVYVDGVAASSQTIGAGGTFSIQLSLPNTSKVYVVTATQKNIDGVESNSTSVGNYNLQVDPPTATISGAPTEASSTSTAAIVVTVAGANVANYKWAMTGSGSDCNSASRSALTAVATNISHTVSSDGNWKLCVWGYDNLGNEQTTATSRTWILDSVAPSVAATLTGAPTGNSASTNVSVTVGGTDIVQYKYVFTTQATACTSGDLTYSNFTPIATLITGNPGSDGNVRLCVKGFDAAANAAPESSADWVKITAPPTISAVTLADKTTASTTMTNTQVINATVTGSATLNQGCFKTTNSTPAAGDSCWGATTQQVTLTTVNSSNTVYAWVRDALGNIQTTPTSATITWTNYCDSGTFDGTCTITVTKTIPANIKLGGVGSLTIDSGVTLTLPNNAVINVTGNLNVYGSTAMTRLFRGTISAANVTVYNGGTLAGNFTIQAVNLDIQSGGVMSAEALGYAGGGANANGTGPALNTYGLSVSEKGSGGAHAGVGAHSITVAGATTTYGSATEPITFGAGGGGGGCGGGAGGHGGGAIKLILSGALTVNGTLSANGTGGGQASGGGAGGSIWINSANLLGAGQISAAGGSSGEQSCNGAGAGAGGGGRIAIYNSVRPFHGTISVDGGKFGLGLLSDIYRGGVGSLYIDSSVSICDTGSLSTTCTITGNTILPGGISISGTGNFVINAGANVSFFPPSDSISISMGQNVTVNGGLLANISNMTASQITVGAAGSINANGLGFAGGVPQSNGNGGSSGGVYSNSYGGGGGHGGIGGLGGAAGASGGAVSGTSSNPSTFGGGGAGSNCAAGGSGGGVIKISTTSLTINGTISANGQNGNNKGGNCGQSGSGAGGSIHISATTLSGTGALLATGGSSVATQGGGGGGGGRIFIDAPSVFRGSGKSSLSIAGGSSGNFQSAAFDLYNGARGSLFYGQTPCDTGTPSTTCTINGLLYLPNASALVVPGNLTVASGGNLYNNPLETAAINVTGNVTVESGGTINANLNPLTANNLTINSGGVISASSLGNISTPIISNININGLGSGGGYGLTACFQAHFGSTGAGYGGSGGNGGGGYAGTAFFGSASKSQPNSFGSSGGAGTGAAGGFGGGIIRLNISNNFSNSGTISSNGGAGGTTATLVGSGGGSGGSIWISAGGTMSGNGTITAIGGAASPSCSTGNSGAGGGGRIAFDGYTTNSYTGSWVVSGGTFLSSNGTSAAGAGSVCDKGAGAGCIN